MGMYLTNVARLDMGSGYAASLLTSSEPVERVTERLQWLKDNGYNWWPLGFGRVAELDSWVPLMGPVPVQGSVHHLSEGGGHDSSQPQQPLPPLDSTDVPAAPPPDTALAPRDGLAGHSQVELLSAVEEIEGLLGLGMALHDTADSWPSGLRPVVIGNQIIRWTEIPT